MLRNSRTGWAHPWWRWGAPAPGGQGTLGRREEYGGQALKAPVMDPGGGGGSSGARVL